MARLTCLFSMQKEMLFPWQLQSINSELINLAKDSPETNSSLLRVLH